jgi:molybdate transport system substrate-binding protein
MLSFGHTEIGRARTQSPGLSQGISPKHCTLPASRAEGLVAKGRFHLRSEPAAARRNPCLRQSSLGRPIIGSRLRLLAASTVLAVALLGGSAHKAEIRLLSAAVMQPVFKEIINDFERGSGHRLAITYATMGAINQRVLDGETGDLIIGSTPSISGLAKAGKIRSDSQLQIAKVGVGIVVPSGTPKLSIASVEDLKRALLAAKTVIYADPAGGGAAGIHVAAVIEKMGISEQIKPKIKFGAGGDITELTLASGPGALGLTQISEIVNKPGAEFVAPLPDKIQNYTGISAGIPTEPTWSKAVVAFLAFLKSTKVDETMKAAGMHVD